MTFINISKIECFFILVLSLVIIYACGAGPEAAYAFSHGGAKNSRAESGEIETEEDAPSRPSIGFETDYISKYVWYGIPLSDGAVAQSSLWLENRGYTYMIYGNFDLAKRVFDQYNLYISKSIQAGPVEAEFALQSYHFPEDEEALSTREFILTLTKPFKNFDLYVSQAWDIQTYKGYYIADFGISLERETPRGGVFKSSLYVEFCSRIFNELNFELSKPGFDMIGSEISYTHTRKDGVYIKPHAEYYTAIDKDLKEIVEKPDTFSYGITVGKTF